MFFCPHSPSATSCVWQRLSSDQSLGFCSTERTNRRAGWPSLCHHPHLLLRHPGIASLIGWLLCSIRPHRWDPLICGQHRLYVCNLTNPMDLLKFISPLEAAHPKVLRFLCCIMLFSTSLSLIWDLCILVIVFIWIWWSCDGHCHYCAILINW